MSAALRNRPRLDDPKAARPVRELAVLVRAGDIVVAIPTRLVSRLILDSELRALGGGSPRLVEAEGVTHAAWDLGEMLFGAESDGAWVLIRTRHRDGELRLALRTGPCLVVVETPAIVPLPPGALSRRASAIAGAFAATTGSASPYGLALKPDELWTGEELDASSACLARGAEP